MQQFAIMCNVSFVTEVYVDAENLPEAMEKLACGDIVTYESVQETFDPLDFVKPQVWDEEKEDYVPCNVVMFPVKDEVEFEEE